MSADVLLAVLAAAFLHAGWNALVKGGRDTLSSSMLVCGGAAVVATPLSFVLAAPLPESFPFVAASAVIHTVYFWLIGIAYRSADLSVVYPLTRGMAPLVTTIAAAILLGEIPAVFGLVGVLCLSAGVLWLAADGLRRGGLDRRSLRAALINTGVIAAYTVVDGQGGRLSGNAVSYNVWMFIVTALVFLPVATTLGGRTRAADVLSGWPIGLVGGGAAFLAYGITIWAMTRAPIGLVAALRETSVLFAAGFGTLFLNERFGPGRYAAAALVAAGLLAIRFA